MKKNLLIALALILVVGVSVPVMAAISGSDHDLTDDFTTLTTNACEYCHFPHNPDPGSQPLWNHTLSTQTFTMYGTTLEGTTPDTAPNSASLRCLSCHDGVTNLDAYGGATGTSTMGDVFPGSPDILGTTLADDHPVSIAITGLPSAGQSQTTLPYYTSKVECSSCHDPHDTSNTFFLRLTNNSSLCTTCHTDK